VCSTHGGTAPQVRHAATRRVAEAQAVVAARRHLDAETLSPITDPSEALQLLASEVLAGKNFFRARIADPQCLEDRNGSGPAPDRLQAELALYERALDRSIRVLEGIARLNVEDRLVALRSRISAAQADKVKAAVNDAMRSAGLPSDVRAAITKELQENLEYYSEGGQGTAPNVRRRQIALMLDELARRAAARGETIAPVS
jgi:hypothetical protein